VLTRPLEGLRQIREAIPEPGFTDSEGEHAQGVFRF
jgi:hypothetical protein